MSFEIKTLRDTLCISAFFVLLLACSADQVEIKLEPVELTREDTGYFCGMIVADHRGPKAQVILEGLGEPLWFTSARDGIAFLRLPEETRPINVFYVSAIDLGGWDHPELNMQSMIEAGVAWFVIASDKLGSMGAPETIPFSSVEAATAFAEQFGGQVLKLADIPDSYILGPDSTSTSAPTMADRH